MLLLFDPTVINLKIVLSLLEWFNFKVAVLQIRPIQYTLKLYELLF